MPLSNFNNRPLSSNLGLGKSGGLGGNLRPGSSLSANKPQGISSISNMSSSAHIYTSGDNTGIYNGNDRAGSHSFGSINSVINRSKNPPTSSISPGGHIGANKPIMPPIV